MRCYMVLLMSCHKSGHYIFCLMRGQVSSWEPMQVPWRYGAMLLPRPLDWVAAQNLKYLNLSKQDQCLKPLLLPTKGSDNRFWLPIGFRVTPKAFCIKFYTALSNSGRIINIIENSPWSWCVREKLQCLRCFRTESKHCGLWPYEWG
jgi:hypothetical protein